MRYSSGILSSTEFRTDGSGQPDGPIFMGTSWPLKMVPTGCPEMSVKNYHYTLHNIPEES